MFPTGIAPFVRLAEDGSGNRLCDDGVFGLLPDFATELAYGRRTYNARARPCTCCPASGRLGRLGIAASIPAERFFAPDCTSGTAVRWAIYQQQVPMGITGIYRP